MHVLRLSLAVVTLIGFSLTGCDNPTSPLADEAPLADGEAASSRAETYHRIETLPTDFEDFVACANGGAGEYVTFTGSIRRVWHGTFDANGNFHGTMHDNAQNLRGTGSVTGTTYRGGGAFNESLSVGRGSTSTLVSSYVLAGQGQESNLRLHATFHFTINANGEVTSNVENLQGSCD